MSNIELVEGAYRKQEKNTPLHTSGRKKNETQSTSVVYHSFVSLPHYHSLPPDRNDVQGMPGMIVTCTRTKLLKKVITVKNTVV